MNAKVNGGRPAICLVMEILELLNDLRLQGMEYRFETRQYNMDMGDNCYDSVAIYLWEKRGDLNTFYTCDSPCFKHGHKAPLINKYVYYSDNNQDDLAEMFFVLKCFKFASEVSA